MSGALAVALTVACGAACALLVAAEWWGWARVRAPAKLAASAAFVALGLGALAEGAGPDPGRAAFVRAIVAGLVLGAIGDAALLGASARAFMLGLGAFLLGHVAYVVAVACLIAPAAWPGAAGPLAALPLAAGAAALRWLWPHLGGMRAPVIAYVLTIVAMVVAAIALARGEALPEPHRLRFVTGAVLFFASDLSVARDRFVAKSRINKAWGLPAYFAGQLLIAWAVLDL